jgi:hypothetical protein
MLASMRKKKSKRETATPRVARLPPRLSLFGPPPLIEGEDAAAYEQLLARFCAAVKPVDIIDEIFIADVVPSEWEVLRLRRLKWSLIRAPALEALEDFLGGTSFSGDGGSRSCFFDPVACSSASLRISASSVFLPSSRCSSHIFFGDCPGRC